MITSMMVWAALSGQEAHAAKEVFTAWDWSEGKTYRYYMSSDVVFAWMFSTLKQTDLRVVTMRGNAYVSCTSPGMMNKKLIKVECTFDDLQVWLQPGSGDSGRLEAVALDIDNTLTGKAVELGVMSNGRIATLDVPGLETGGRRGDMEAVVREFAGQMISGLDIEFENAPAWKQKTGWSFNGLRPMGGVMKHTAKVKDGVWTIETEGTYMRSENAESSAASLLEMKMVGTTTHDVGKGHLVKREVKVDGLPTGGAARLTEYHRALVVELIEDDVEVTALGNSGELGFTQEVQPEAPAAEAAPVEEAPAEEAPADEAPAEEAPAE